MVANSHPQSEAHHVQCPTRRTPAVAGPSVSQKSDINSPVAQRYPSQQSSVHFMWGTVFVLALLTANDPVRLGIAALLIVRPRPLLNLLVFWLGGMAAGIAGGLSVLMLLRDFLPLVIQDVTSVVARLTGGPTQIAIGLLALLIAARIAGRLSAHQQVRVPALAAGPLAEVPQPSTPTIFARLSAIAKHALGGGHPWVSFVAGLGSATPPIEYLVALAAIAASKPAAGAQVGAVVMFTVVVLAVVEIPLVSYLATPAKTQAVMLQLHKWVCARRRLIFAMILAATGVMLVARGMGNI